MWIPSSHMLCVTKNETSLLSTIHHHPSLNLPGLYGALCNLFYTLLNKGCFFFQLYCLLISPKSNRTLYFSNQMIYMILFYLLLMPVTMYCNCNFDLLSVKKINWPQELVKSKWCFISITQAETFKSNGEDGTCTLLLIIWELQE